MTETKLSDLIGLSEMAEILGVTKNEANALRQRPGFPTPKLKFKMGPAWDLREVQAYVGLSNAPQKASVLCAWCKGNSFNEAEKEGWATTHGMITCADCSGISKVDIVVDEHDHFANGLSLKVTKYDGLGF